MTAASGSFTVLCVFFCNVRCTYGAARMSRLFTGFSGSVIYKRSPAIIAKLHIIIFHIFFLHIIIPPGQVSWTAARAAYPLCACVILQRLPRQCIWFLSMIYTECRAPLSRRHGQRCRCPTMLMIHPAGSTYTAALRSISSGSAAKAQDVSKTAR